MPYKQVVPDLEIPWNDNSVKPLVTLADEHGCRAQIVLDDHCYVLLLRRAGVVDHYEPTYWWFKEAFVAIRDLRLPE